MSPRMRPGRRQFSEALKASNPIQRQQPAEQTDVEIARTNPKPEQSQPSAGVENHKTKRMLPEPEPEIAQTNSIAKSAMAFSAQRGKASWPLPDLPQPAPRRPANRMLPIPSNTPSSRQNRPSAMTSPARSRSHPVARWRQSRCPSGGTKRQREATVRSSDTTHWALRGELIELVRTLDQKGYKTETWTPADTYPLGKSETREVQAHVRGDSPSDWSGGQPGGGHPDDSQQQKQQKQNRPDWLIELERRLLQKEE